jgi:hypothetical protein
MHTAYRWTFLAAVVAAAACGSAPSQPAGVTNTQPAPVNRSGSELNTTGNGPSQNSGALPGLGGSSYGGTDTTGANAPGRYPPIAPTPTLTTTTPPPAPSPTIPPPAPSPSPTTYTPLPPAPAPSPTPYTPTPSPSPSPTMPPPPTH